MGTDRAAVETPVPARVANRCACGHAPTTHMIVVAISDGGLGGFRLDPDGPCALCGSGSCARYAPVP